MSDQAPPSIRIMCPNLACRKVLLVPTNCRGKTVRCRNCGTNIRVPAPMAIEKPTDGKASQKAA